MYRINVIKIYISIIYICCFVSFLDSIRCSNKKNNDNLINLYFKFLFFNNYNI